MSCLAAICVVLQAFLSKKSTTGEGAAGGLEENIDALLSAQKLGQEGVEIFERAK